MIQSVVVTLKQLGSVCSSHFLLAHVPMRQIPEGPAVPSVGNVKKANRFVDL